MANRTDVSKVKKILGHHYDTVTCPDLTPFVEAANSIVSQMTDCAEDRGISITSVQAELVERWMAAEYYMQSDPAYKSKNTAGAGASFNEVNYLKVAMALDPSGCLSTIIGPTKTVPVGLYWLGKSVSTQVPASERD